MIIVCLCSFKVLHFVFLNKNGFPINVSQYIAIVVSFRKIWWP